jgi:tripartite-type tricarboxylate transporter receptor subunit TctC
VQQQLTAQGAVAHFGTAAEFSTLIAADRKKYARIITENNVTAD